MDSSAIPVYMAGPFPVLHSAHVDDELGEIELDVALLIGGLPTMIAATSFDLDETWGRVDAALRSGDAKLGVAGMPHEAESLTGQPEVYPSAFIGLECANGEKLVLAHIRGLEPGQEAETYAREVITAIMQGLTPGELGEHVDA
jgi:hypothetical protein